MSTTDVSRLRGGLGCLWAPNNTALDCLLAQGRRCWAVATPKSPNNTALAPGGPQQHRPRLPPGSRATLLGSCGSRQAPTTPPSTASWLKGDVVGQSRPRNPPTTPPSLPAGPNNSALGCLPAGPNNTALGCLLAQGRRCWAVAAPGRPQQTPPRPSTTRNLSGGRARH
jgi:hypothetical protein